MIPRPSLAPLLALALLGSLSSTVLAAPAPAFSLRVLGATGGGDEADISCYLLARPGEPAAVMLDGGSIIPGILRWKERDGALAATAGWSERMRVVDEVLRPLRAVLLTHSHLDHVAGFILGNGHDSDLALAGRPTLEVIALPETLAALTAHAWSGPLWGDFSKLPPPPHAPALHLAPLAPGNTIAAGPFTVEALPLRHTIASAAFLVRSGDAYYLHLGDTGPSTAVWQAARPLWLRHALRAVAIEVSFPSTREAFARQTGHLTPRSLLGELARLVGETPPDVDKMSDSDARALAHRLGGKLGATRVIAIHIKAPDHDAVVEELHALRASGLDVTIAAQGERYDF